jgi:2'-hydroxyisoflavone reductase
MNKNFSRRDFIRSMGLLTGVSCLPLSTLYATDTPAQKVDIAFYKDSSVKRAEKKLNILVLGGTGFIGPPMVQFALERGHKVTLLNRGVSNPHLFKNLPRIKADRLNGLGSVVKQLQQPWDVVIDTWQLNPLAVQQTVDLLEGYAAHYIYASSIAVYGRKNYDNNQEIFEPLSIPIPESVPTDLKEVVNDYRTCKYLAELAVQKAFPAVSSVIRFHNIVGFYMAPASEGQIYWPVRFQRGGDILLPGDGKDQMQTIDVKDAARWMIHCAENKLLGVYNAGRRYSWMEYAGACRSLSAKECRLFWVSIEKLTEQKVKVNSDMPYYIPRTWGPGFFNISDKRALENGIHYRPLAATLADVISGFNTHYKNDYEFGPPNCNAGLSLEREKTVLKNLNLIS